MVRATLKAYRRLPATQGQGSQNGVPEDGVGADGIRLLAKLDDPEAPQGLKQLPEVEILRKIWGQQYVEIAKEGSGYSTQERYLKPLAAWNPPTKQRPATPVRAL